MSGRGGRTQGHRPGAARAWLERRRRTAVDQDPVSRSVGPEAVGATLHRSCRITHFPAADGGAEEARARHRQPEGGRQSGQRDGGQVGYFHGHGQRRRGGVALAGHGDFRGFLTAAGLGGEDACPVPGRRRRGQRLQVDGVQAQVVLFACAAHDRPGGAVQQRYAAAGRGPGDRIDRHRERTVRPPPQARRKALDTRGW